MEYRGPNVKIKCPHCGQQLELFPKGWEDRSMSTYKCGNTGAISKVRSPSGGCGDLLGVKFELKANVKLYKMTPA